MELKELKGKHQLDAVDFTDEKIKNWADQYEDCQVCRFRLDGVVYMAAEDPDDGYRSNMRDLIVDESANMKNVFPAIEVLARHRTESNDDGWLQEDDILELIDTTTGEIVLTVGTENTDDYYPYFIANFVPGAMVTNASMRKKNGVMK